MKYEIRYTKQFQKTYKKLSKKYSNVGKDIKAVIPELKAGRFLGDRIKGTGEAIYKLRVKSTDITKGKSGGYRLIYLVYAKKTIFFVTMYAKVRAENLTEKKIKDIVSKHIPK